MSFRNVLSVNLSFTDVVIPAAIVHFIWNKFIVSKVPELIKHAGNFALSVVRVSVSIIAIEVLLSLLVLPAQYFSSTDPSNQLYNNGWEKHNVSLYDENTNSQIFLSAAVYEPPNFKSDRNVIFLCPNGVGFEHVAMGFLKGYASDIRARMIAFNFRGVGASVGEATSAQDLVDDTAAVIKYVVEKFRVNPANILLHGWSLGGAVAILARQVFPEVAIVNDRSFDTLGHAAISMSDSYLVRFAIGIIVGFLLSFCSSSKLRTMLDRARYLCGIMGLLAVVMNMNILIPYVLETFGWEMKVDDPNLLYSAPLCVVFHRFDGLIDYDIAALHPRVAVGLHESVFEFNLTKLIDEHDPSSLPHLYNVRSVYSEWNSLLETCILPMIGKS